MNYKRVLDCIIDIGEAMVNSGAEISRVEDSMYRLCRSYGFVRVNCWTIATNIQMTVESPDGEILTQIRYVTGREMDFDRLDYLNDLCRKACTKTPDAAQLKESLTKVMERPGKPKWEHYLAGIMGGVGFAAFFACDLVDTLAAVIASAIIITVKDGLEKYERNPLVINAITAFLAECLILLCVKLGLGHNYSNITVGVVMLLISGIGFTNGIRDLMHTDTLSGLINLARSVLGASGIAIGIALPIFLIKEENFDAMELSPSLIIQLVSCTIACVGFALWFNVKGKQVAFAGIGAFLTWFVYALLFDAWQSNFLATLAGAVFVAAYAQLMARVNKAPATIFLTTTVFPLVPGPNLYYMMYWIVGRNYTAAMQEAITLILTCLGIVFGFLIIEILSKYSTLILGKLKKSQ